MVKITHINHACFLIETQNGTRIYLDPYQIPPEFEQKPADLILASHNHHDHLEEQSIQIIQTTKTKFVCPASLTKEVKQYHAHGVKPGDNITELGFLINIIPAYNPNKRFHPKSNQWIGFIINVDGWNIMHAGDTDFIPEYNSLEGKVDVALLPVGDTYTMDFMEAIKAVSVIQPKIVIPMHSWDKDLAIFKKECSDQNPSVKVEILQSGALEL